MFIKIAVQSTFYSSIYHTIYRIFWNRKVLLVWSCLFFMKINGKSLLEDVLPEDYLEVGKDVTVKNLRDLVEVLRSLSDDEFGLYVYGEHNDFAEWILEAYWNKELATKIIGIRDRKKMIRALEKFLGKAEKRRFSESKKKDVLEKIGSAGC